MQTRGIYEYSYEYIIFWGFSQAVSFRLLGFYRDCNDAFTSILLYCTVYLYEYEYSGITRTVQVLYPARRLVPPVRLLYSTVCRQ